MVEVDDALAPPLEDAVGGFDNVTLHMVDALALDFAALRPRPDKLVANLPYGVAATVLLKALEELGDARLFVAMVQREVAERLAARPGTAAYGATSAIAQLSCEVSVAKRVSSRAFTPAPRVESAVCVMRRVAPAPAPAVIAPGARRLRPPAQDARRLRWRCGSRRRTGGGAARAPEPGRR